MERRVLWISMLAFVVVGAGGCKSAPPEAPKAAPEAKAAFPAPTRPKPEQALSAWVIALSVGGGYLDDLVPTDQAWSSVLDCGTKALPPSASYLDVGRRHAAEIAALGAKVELLRMVADKKREELHAGDRWNGCKVLGNLTVLKARAEYRLTLRDGTAIEDDDDAKLVSVGGQWYLRKPFVVDLNVR